eukprot:Em0014g393a
MSGAAKRKLKKPQEKLITKLRKLDDLGFINIVAPTNMSESSATTTVDQSGDRACNELNSSNPEGMIPLEAEALSLGSHAESGYEDNAYPGYPIEKCSSSECKSSSSLLREYSGDVALWKNISKENVVCRFEEIINSPHNGIYINFMAVFWNIILERLNRVSVALQSAEIELGTAVKLLQSLQDFVSELRGNLDAIEMRATQKDPSAKYTDAEKE